MVGGIQIRTVLVVLATAIEKVPWLWRDDDARGTLHSV